MVTMESLQETTIALLNVTIADSLYHLSFPKVVFPSAPTRINFATRAAPSEYDRRYRQLCAVPDVIMSREMSRFDKLLSAVTRSVLGRTTELFS